MALGMAVADPFAGSLVTLACLWLLAKVGGEVALRLRMPAVAGELTAGILLAFLHRSLPGIPDVTRSVPTEAFANLGVVLLMFAVGLESTIPQMLRVGWPSLRVAVMGVITPMAMGLIAVWLLVPAGTSFVAQLFIATCLCATSIGISAQVLRDNGAGSSEEGRVIIGAAVIDDVLGLLVLVAVSGLVIATSGGAGLPWGGLAKMLGAALLFLSLALTLGRYMTPRFFRLASRFRSEQLLLPLSLALAFFMAWLGNLAGLATIVGAYAAGLILEPGHIMIIEERESHRLEDLLHPLVTVFAPLFFILMGARVDPQAFLSFQTIYMAFVLAAVGVLGKYLAGYAAGKGFHAGVIGWGMVPRGEVGLIFVAAGSTLTLDGHPLLSTQIQAGLVGALLLTTMIGPIGLGLTLRKRQAEPNAE